MNRRNTRSRSEAIESFKCNFLDILEDEEAISRLHLIFEPMSKTLLSPLSSKMQETINILSETVAQLKKENETKDVQIRDLKNEVKVMTNRIDDLEQHGRRDSMRIFGLSESTPGSTDEKVLRLCNTRMKLQPLLGWDCSVPSCWQTPRWNQWDDSCTS